MGFAALGLLLTSCDESAVEESVAGATVEITNATSTEHNISFDLVIDNATEAGYVTMKAEDVTNSSLTAEGVLESAVVLDKATSQSVEVEELEPNTSYVTVAYVKNSADEVTLSSPSYVKTLEAEALAEVELDNISAQSDELTFKITLTAATEAGYYCLSDADVTENSFTEESVLANATKLPEPMSQEVILTGLEAETAYSIVAYAKNVDGVVTLSETLHITTDAKLAKVAISIKEISTTTESMTFEITPENNPDACYWWFYKMTDDFEERDSQTIVSAGETTSAVVPETFTREGLLDNTTYVVYAVAVVSGTYEQIMTRLEITTPALENPVQKEVQEFSSVDFSSFSGRMHTFKFANSNYAIDIVLQTPTSFLPCVPTGDFVYDANGGGGEPWYIATTTTQIYDKQDGNRKLTINRGSATLSYDSTTGDYTLEGTFQTSENVHIPYKFVGAITYPISIHYNFGLYTSEDNLLNFEKCDNCYKLKLYLAEGVTVGEGKYSFENGKLSDKSVIDVFDYSGEALSSIKFKELEFDFKSDGVNRYRLSGLGVTTDGYTVEIVGDGLNVDITDVALPELPVLKLTNPNALCEYAGGWSPYYYSLEFDCDELTDFFAGLALSEGGDYIPEGYYAYMEEYGSFQYFAVTTNSGSDYKFYDEGGVTVSRDGDIYTIDFEVKLWMGSDDRMFKAQYVGPIDVYFDDTSGGGYDDYYYNKRKQGK